MVVILSCLILLGIAALIFNMALKKRFMTVITVISLVWLIGLAIKFY